MYMAGMRRSKRTFMSPDEARALLEAVRPSRDACTRALARAPIGTPVYKATSAVIDAIDTLAEVTMGSREHFWEGHQSAGPGPGTVH